MGTSFSFPFSSPFGDASFPDPAPPVAPLRLPPNFGVKTDTPFLVNDARVVVLIPTAINTCLIAAENITDNLRAQQASDLELPSLYKRAFLVAYETDEIALVRK